MNRNHDRMTRWFRILTLVAATTLWPGSWLASSFASDGPVPAEISIDESHPLVQLAAKEIRRYHYLRTDSLLSISEIASAERTVLLVGTKDSNRIAYAVASDPSLRRAISRLAAEGYLLAEFSAGHQEVFLVVGGSPRGALYGAYDLCERMGVRYELHGDIIPDKKIDAAAFWASLELDGKPVAPLFAHRGIQPFHDFPEGPDWWSRQDYTAVLAQMAKLRMNFFGLHTYPEGGVGPEPTVWIGPAAEMDDDGNPRMSYPSRHFTTSNPQGSWGYRPTKTSDYYFGAGDLFEKDDYGPAHMDGMQPFQEQTMEESNELFVRFGRELDACFTFAQELGIQTCVGTETPLVLPRPLKERLEKRGLDSDDPAVVQEVYEGIFQRIEKTHPLDYYWFWTPETWTWRDVPQEKVDATKRDFAAAIAAYNEVNPSFKLATCGWVLGPPQAPSLFDDFLPKQVAMSCINRHLGFAPVEPGFREVEGRSKWAIPWMEDDPAMIIPQLWVGRMRRDAVDALDYGCTGLLGIHWRTRVVGPNVSALAHAAWDQSVWRPTEKVDPATASQRVRDMPCADFYLDWCTAQFGNEVAEPMAKIFASLDGGSKELKMSPGHLPRPATWVNGPGGIQPDVRPWEEAKQDYAFVDEIAALRDRVRGVGSLERFDYWLGQFRYLQQVGRVACVWDKFRQAMERLDATKDLDAKRKRIRKEIFPLRGDLLLAVQNANGLLAQTVTTTGGRGNIANWQQHIIPQLITEPGAKLEQILGEPLPAEMQLTDESRGLPALYVPVLPTLLCQGEDMHLRVIHCRETNAPTIYYRPLGQGEWKTTSTQRLRGCVYLGSIPASTLAGDFECYVQLPGESAATSRWPRSAPTIPHTVVRLPAEQPSKAPLQPGRSNW